MHCPPHTVPLQSSDPPMGVCGQTFVNRLTADAGHRVAYGSSVHWHGFPGIMPVPLRKEHLVRLREGDYAIAEKSDGLRCLLLVIEGAVVLVDRAGQCYEVRGPRPLGSGVTWADGECRRAYAVKRPGCC